MQELNCPRVTEIVRYATQPIDKLLMEQETTPLMIRGSLYHAHILRAETDKTKLPDGLVLIEADSYRTKEAQNQRDLALSQGKLPVLAKEWQEITSLSDSVLAELHKEFNKGAQFEVFKSGQVGNYGMIKGHIDCLNTDFLCDLKISAQNDRLDKKIFDSGYQLQVYLYMLLAKVDRAKLVFLNPATNAIFVKELSYYELITECETLLGVAFEKMAKVEKIKAQGFYKEISHYETPQWAYNELLSNI